MERVYLHVCTCWEQHVGHSPQLSVFSPAAYNCLENEICIYLCNIQKVLQIIKQVKKRKICRRKCQLDANRFSKTPRCYSKSEPLVVKSFNNNSLHLFIVGNSWSLMYGRSSCDGLPYSNQYGTWIKNEEVPKRKHEVQGQ